MATLSPNLSISLGQRRWACVLDPSLFLSHYGVLLVQSLGEVLELWIARELWHILDNPSFYLSQPAWEQSPELQTMSQQKRSQALRHWELLRLQTPPADLNLFWIGDRPVDSLLPDGTDPQIVKSWEVLARSLEERSQQSAPSNVLVSSFRDTIALSAVLGSAFILTHQPSGKSQQPNNPPKICLQLEHFGIPCRRIDSTDAIAVIERENLLQLMISIGLSKVLWAGLRLVVLHLFVPSALTTSCKTQSSWTTLVLDEGEVPEACLLNYWEGAQGFWYRL